MEIARDDARGAAPSTHAFAAPTRTLYATLRRTHRLLRPINRSLRRATIGGTRRPNATPDAHAILRADTLRRRAAHLAHAVLPINAAADGCLFCGRFRRKRQARWHCASGARLHGRTRLCAAALGVAAASLGKVFGDTGGDFLRVTVSLLAVVFGLNLLQLVPLQLGLGSLLVDPSGMGGKVPPAARAFVFGASSALVASPCASPVLATILAFVATLGDPLLGGALLVSYTLGYTTPIAAASLVTSNAARTAQSLEGRFNWVQPAGGAFLIAYGTYNCLVAALGPA